MENKTMISKNIYWIGKIDNRDVPFHRLTLTKGTTYNSYLLMAEKPTVIDTVDISFGREFVENLKNLVDLDKIQYIVINHSEPDHSGGLGALAAKAKNAVIVCTKPAVYELKEMYKLHNREFLIVKNGDTLDIGGKTLKFIETPYLHTEETMITYCEEDKILFPCDIFSTHIANYEYFSDLIKEDIIEDFKLYYTLIMHPHRIYVQEMIKKIKDLDIKTIAPAHGFILRKDVNKFIELYNNMSKDTEKHKSAVILYSTMTGNTKKVAAMLQENLEKSNISVEVINVNKTLKEDIIKSIKKADALFIGSSTKYADMIGSLEQIIKEIENMNLKNKIGGAFGSYGWSGEAIEVVQDYLNKTNMKVLSTSEIIKSTGMTDIQFPIRVRFSPQEEDIKNIKRAASYITGLLLSR